MLITFRSQPTYMRKRRYWCKKKYNWFCIRVPELLQTSGYLTLLNHSKKSKDIFIYFVFF
uniref:Uncharacterized protein n=1 Tax=Cynoglossus semilaevis TaxID=244447 RepID=A0A3P8VPU7_CYNSE